jgi:hypothetical protein
MIVAQAPVRLAHHLRKNGDLFSRHSEFETGSRNSVAQAVEATLAMSAITPSARLSGRRGRAASLRATEGVREQASGAALVADVNEMRDALGCSRGGKRAPKAKRRRMTRCAACRLSSTDHRRSARPSTMRAVVGDDRDDRGALTL